MTYTEGGRPNDDPASHNSQLIFNSPFYIAQMQGGRDPLYCNAINALPSRSEDLGTETARDRALTFPSFVVALTTSC